MATLIWVDCTTDSTGRERADYNDEKLLDERFRGYINGNYQQATCFRLKARGQAAVVRLSVKCEVWIVKR